MTRQTDDEIARGWYPFEPIEDPDWEIDEAGADDWADAERIIARIREQERQREIDWNKTEVDHDLD